jgi:hypothetical protein
VTTLNKKDISGIIDYAENSAENFAAFAKTNAMKNFAEYLSQKTNNPVFVPLIPRKDSDTHLVGRRWKYIPHIIPGVTSKKIDFAKPENKKHFSSYLSNLQKSH